MSWVQDLAGFANQLLMLESRVETNAEEIKELRQDLKSLTDFTQKVAYAVKRNEERRVGQHENLVLRLKVELLELEKRLSASSQNLNQPHVLNEGNGARSVLGASNNENAL